MRTPFASRGRPEPERPEGRAPNGLEWESVWDYPRPPLLERCRRRVEVRFAGERVAASERALRVCETAGAPVVYLPPADVVTGLLEPARGETFCEFKGVASYLDVVAAGRRAGRAAWRYRQPNGRYAELADHVAFYPALVECTLDGEPVHPQPGGFYGGWVTAEITGPIKGEPGSEAW